MFWIQRSITLPPFPRGFHLITPQIEGAIPERVRLEAGLLHAFVQHSSASLLVSEGADPDVPADLERWYSAIVREDFPYHHTCEGPDDMPAHVKATLLGSSVTLPVRQGRLALGTWQGIFLGEHRDEPRSRTLLLTLHGLAASS